MDLIAHSIATLLAGIFAGTCLYVTAVGHRVRLAIGGEMALTHFRTSVVKSERMQPALHVLSLIATITALALSVTPTRIAAVVLLAPVLPLSLIAIVPLNNALKDDALLPGSEQASAHLKRWGTLHGLRTTAAICGFAALAIHT